MSAIHQVIDVRTFGSRYQFTDAAGEQQHLAKMQAFRASIPANVKHVVGPDDEVLTRDGKRLGPGEPVSVEAVSGDVGYPGTGRAPWQVFAQLVKEERVIENYAYVPPAPEAAQ